MNVEELEYKNHKIVIKYDECPENPREWDNFGKMICFHGNYSLGDKHDYKSDHYSGWAELKKAIVKNEKAAVILPLYLIDHSGISISTTPFMDKWDSGPVGFTFATKKDIQESFTKTDEDIMVRAERLLKAEVKIYDAYLRGEVFGYLISKDTEDIDSCYGYYSLNETIDEAKRVIDYREKKEVEEKWEKFSECEAAMAG